MKRLSFLVALVLAVPALAQTADPQAAVPTSYFKGKLSDFDKVQILCSGDESGDLLTNALCAVVDTEVRTGARDAGMDVVVGNPKEKGDSFTIFARVHSAGKYPRAVSVRVEASRYYEAAVDKDARYATAATAERSGKLVMWEETITGVGGGDALEMPMRKRLREVLRALFKDIERDRR